MYTRLQRKSGMRSAVVVACTSKRQVPSLSDWPTLPMWAVFLVLGCIGRIGFCHEFAGGTGEPNDPYQIATTEQLISIGSDPNLLNKHYVLVNNIDLDPCLPGGRVFRQAVIAPIWDLATDSLGGPFSGSFDGHGHKIQGLTIDVRQAEGSAGTAVRMDTIGLFGRIAEQAAVADLSVSDANVYGGGNLGILAGWNDGTISLCYTSGSVTGSYNVGGLVGWNEKHGELSQCSSTSSVVGSGDVGGLVGRSFGSVTYCAWSKGVIAGGSCGGGLVGSNCGTLKHCTSSGMVSGGGGDAGVGGLTGWSVGDLGDCSSSGMVRGTGTMLHVGGLVGQFFWGTAIRCHSTAVVIGDHSVGGAFGWIREGTVKYCSSTGLVFGTGMSSECGGFVGVNDGVIDSCFSKSDVSGISNVGGFLSQNWMSVTNSYSSGSVRGESIVGGFAAEVKGTRCVLKDCYSYGHASGKTTVGGFLAKKSGGSVNDCFWDTQTSELTVSAGGKGLSTEAMQDINTYLGVGWDFVGETANGTEDVWTMPLGNKDYPRLVWE